MIKAVPHLEIHVAHACNLTCESCAHYSNHGHKGIVTLAEAEAWMAAWSGRIAPDLFSLLGGEPTVHPQLTEFLLLARKHWPRAKLRIVTNGFFLHRHPDLPKVLGADGNTMVQLSIHHASPEYKEKFAPVIELLHAWHRDHGVQIKPVASFGKWTRRYQAFGEQMLPFEHGNPRSSWETCPAKTAPQLFEGSLWKCAPLAYLGMQAEKYELSEKWTPYLAYRPLQAGCDDAQLEAFFAREDEPFCAMCASSPQPFDLPDPLPATRRRPVKVPVRVE